MYHAYIEKIIKILFVMSRLAHLKTDRYIFEIHIDNTEVVLGKRPAGASPYSAKL